MQNIFLHTMPLLNEAFMLGSAAAVAVGWLSIRQGRRERHRALMLSGAALAVLFFLGYALRTLVVGDTLFGGPRVLALPYQVFLQAHTLLATVAAVFGIVTLRFALREEFTRHRRVAPWTASIWFVAAGTGLVVFLMLYVIFAPGPTTNVFRAVVGH
jgi:putative membrane protein